jgi:sec-independent protein translocase protein TatB
MELFGIGPLELLFILIIALIVLGPRDMVKAGNTLGRLMRKTILSPTWLKIQREVRSLPYQMMREAGLEEADLRVDMGLKETLKDMDLRDAFNKDLNSSTSPPEQNQAPLPAFSEQNTIGQHENIPGDVPGEWLGLPSPGLAPTDGHGPSDGFNPLSEWTSAPEIEALPDDPPPGLPDDEPDEAKDAT